MTVRSRARKPASPSSAKISGYPKAGVALDRLVEVDEDRPVARREAPPDGALATPRQADQDDVHLVRPP